MIKNPKKHTKSFKNKYLRYIISDSSVSGDTGHFHYRNCSLLLYSLFQVASGLKRVILPATLAVFSPRSFSNTTPS